MTTSAPARARAIAITFPIRRDPPVTRAARPAKLMADRSNDESALAFRRPWSRVAERWAIEREASGRITRRFRTRAACTRPDASDEERGHVVLRRPAGSTFGGACGRRTKARVTLGRTKVDIVNPSTVLNGSRPVARCRTQA